MSIIRPVEFLTSCALAVLLTACGGGGGDEAPEAGNGSRSTINSAPGDVPGPQSAITAQATSENLATADSADVVDAVSAESLALAFNEIATVETHAADPIEVADAAPAAYGSHRAAENLTDEKVVVATADGVTAAAPKDGSTRSIAATDVMAYARSDTPLSTQTWDYQCYGQNKSAKTIPLVGVIGSELLDAPRMRLGLEKAQPADAVRGIVLRTASADPITAGAPRCEVSFTRGDNSFLPRGKDFWFASRIWIDDWSSSSDEQLVMQFHAGDSSQNLGPFFALYVRGDRARAALRYDTQTAGRTSMSTRASNDIWSGPANFTRRWATVVVQARISTNADEGPFLRFWIDGQLLGQHVGPVGYNGTGSDYAKVGFYHWLSGNAWDTNVPVRTMYVSRSMLVNDASQAYTEADLRAAVE